jgi:hypothetical protein
VNLTCQSFCMWICTKIPPSSVDLLVTKLYHILIIRIWVFVSHVYEERSLYHYCWNINVTEESVK